MKKHQLTLVFCIQKCWLKTSGDIIVIYSILWLSKSEKSSEKCVETALFSDFRYPQNRGGWENALGDTHEWPGFRPKRSLLPSGCCCCCCRRCCCWCWCWWWCWWWCCCCCCCCSPPPFPTPRPPKLPSERTNAQGLRTPEGQGPRKHVQIRFGHRCVRIKTRTKPLFSRWGP